MRFFKLFFSLRAFAIRAQIALPSLVRLSTVPFLVFLTVVFLTAIVSNNIINSTMFDYSIIR